MLRAQIEVNPCLNELRFPKMPGATTGRRVHRIAQIFRERGVDISVPHLVRTVRRFVDEEERAGNASRAPTGPMTKERHPESNPEATNAKAPVTYQMSEQPSALVQEEEFAKQLRLAR